MTELIRRLAAAAAERVDASGGSCCEGVETTEHLAKLRALGCERAQGHYFCEAVPPDSPGLFPTHTPVSHSA